MNTFSRLAGFERKTLYINRFTQELQTCSSGVAYILRSIFEDFNV